MTQTKPVFAHCYWCDKLFPEIPERRGRHKEGIQPRKVVFCSQDHFRRYLAANSKDPRRILPPEEIVLRAEQRLEELKSDSMFLKDFSTEKLIKESVIFEFMEIIEGHPRVTKHERCSLPG